MVSRRAYYQTPLGKEARVRRLLARRFGMKFRKRRLPSSGTKHVFDAVSQNGKIVAEVKSSGLNKKTGKLRFAVRDNLTAACMFLLTTKAKCKLLVLTDGRTHGCFIQTLEAKASQKMGVKIITQNQIKNLCAESQLPPSLVLKRARRSWRR